MSELVNQGWRRQAITDMGLTAASSAQGPLRSSSLRSAKDMREEALNYEIMSRLVVFWICDSSVLLGRIGNTRNAKCRILDRSLYIQNCPEPAHDHLKQVSQVLMTSSFWRLR